MIRYFRSRPRPRLAWIAAGTLVTIALAAIDVLDISAQSARTTRRGRVYQGEEGSAAVGRRGG